MFLHSCVYNSFSSSEDLGLPSCNWFVQPEERNLNGSNASQPSTTIVAVVSRCVLQMSPSNQFDQSIVFQAVHGQTNISAVSN